MHICVRSHFSCVRLFVTLWTVACQTPLSVGFSWKEYWSGFPFPSLRDLWRKVLVWGWREDSMIHTNKKEIWGKQSPVRGPWVSTSVLDQSVYRHPILGSLMSTQSRVLVFQPPGPQNVTLFGVGSLERKLRGGTCGKESACQCKRHWRHRFDPWVRKIPWRRKWQSTPVFLTWKSVYRVPRSQTRLKDWTHTYRLKWDHEGGS